MDYLIKVMIIFYIINGGKMSSDSKLETHIQKNDLAIQELSIRIEALNHHVNELFAELNVFPEQLTTFVENKNNFTEDNWKMLLEQRKALDEKLLKELLNISNPKKTKEAFKSLHVQSHWLFVR